MHWNVIVTVRPGHARQHELLGALAAFGRFHATAFRDVCLGEVADTGAFLEALHAAGASGRTWFAHVGRVIPAEATFAFAPDTLAEQFKRAAAPLVERMDSGTFHVRLERRGLEGKVHSPAVEREVAEHLYEIAERQGKTLRTAFHDPDYVVVGETVGQECGVALLTRELRSRFTFVQAH